MSTIEPDDDGANALLDSLDFGDLADEEAADYQSLSNRELVIKYDDVTKELEATGEMIFPKSDNAQNLSAVYHGLLLEMKRRGFA